MLVFCLYPLAKSVESIFFFFCDTNLHLFLESNTADFKMCGRSIRKVTENHTIFDKFRLRNIVTSVFLLYTKHNLYSHPGIFSVKVIKSIDKTLKIHRL